MTSTPGGTAPGRAVPIAGIAILVLVIFSGLWWVLEDRAARSDALADAGPQRAQPLDWISFEQPAGAWRYDRISATIVLGWLGDRSGAGDLATLQVAVAPAVQSLAEVRADYRDDIEAAASFARIDESDTRIPGTDAAIVLVASGAGDDLDLAIVVLLMEVEDRIVTFVLGSAGDPTVAELRSTVTSVRIDRDVLVAQLG